ncbi:unnamed protein product [Calypogeia fissa]
MTGSTKGRKSSVVVFLVRSPVINTGRRKDSSMAPPNQFGKDTSYEDTGSTQEASIFGTRRWVKELAKLGYTNDLPRPCNVAIQTTIASIRDGEIHSAIQAHERAALASQHGDEPGQFFMRLLGIKEWFSIYLLAKQGGVQTALLRLKEYEGILECMEGEDAFKLEKANASIREIAATLNKVALDTKLAYSGADNPVSPTSVTTNFSGPGASSSSTLVSSPSIIIADSLSRTDSVSPLAAQVQDVTPDSSRTTRDLIFPLTTNVDLRSSIKENPLLDLDYLTEDELIEMNLSISYVDPAPLPSPIDAPKPTGPEEPFVPLLPPHYIEWESSKEDGCLWRIKNINNLAPISLDMWQAWGTVSTDEVLQCRERAFQSITLCDKPPVYISQWPMMVFGPPKYKCQVAAGAKIRGKLETQNCRIKEHKSKLWNCHRPFFRCSCHYNTKTGCNGQIVWLDHAVWYMLNHLEDFFSANSAQGRLVMLIKFLSGDARKMVLDHIAFLYICDFLITAAHKYVADPEAKLLAAYGDAKGIRMIEELIKPGMFSEEKSSSGKKGLNLNIQPAVQPKRRSMYANPAPTMGSGRGGPGGPTRGLVQGGNTGDIMLRSRMGHGKTLPGNISPLLRRNIPF